MSNDSLDEAMQASKEGGNDSFLDTCAVVLGKTFGDKIERVLDGLEFQNESNRKITYDWHTGQWKYSPRDKVKQYTTVFSISRDKSMYVLDPNVSFGHNVMTELLCPAESVEVPWFLDNAPRKLFEKVVWVDASLSQVIEGVYLQVPEMVDPAEPLLNISDPSISGDMPKELGVWIKSAIESACEGYLERIESNLTVILKKHDAWLSSKAKQVKANEDLVWIPGPSPSDYRWQITDTRPDWFDIDKHSLPVLVVKVRKRHSLMYTYDLFRTSGGPEKQLHDILKRWESVDQCSDLLKNTPLIIPSSKCAQIKESIELRSARHHYKVVFDLLFNSPEESGIPKELYRKRTALLVKLHSEQLDDLDSYLNPLPFFVDRPNHNFIKAVDDIDKLTTGAKLLDIIVKVVPLLVLQEIKSKDKMTHNNELQRVFGLVHRRMSLGDWVAVTNILQELSANESLLFFDLLNNWPISCVERMVTARNRYHHPPNDWRTFVKTLEENIPPCIASIRSALQGISFIYPESAKVRENGTEITAKYVMGHDLPLSKKTLITELKAEMFPSEKLIAYKDMDTIVLGDYFTCKHQVGLYLNIGIYDGVDGDSPSFEFILTDMF